MYKAPSFLKLSNITWDHLLWQLTVFWENHVFCKNFQNCSLKTSKTHLSFALCKNYVRGVFVSKLRCRTTRHGQFYCRCKVWECSLFKNFLRYLEHEAFKCIYICGVRTFIKEAYDTYVYTVVSQDLFASKITGSLWYTPGGVPDQNRNSNLYQASHVHKVTMINQNPILHILQNLIPL